MIKFNKFNVTSDTAKARVIYSKGQIYANVKAGMEGGLRECVTLYAKDFQSGRALQSMLGDNYQNDSDSQSDYFDEGRVRLFPDHPLYQAARARCAA